MKLECVRCGSKDFRQIFEKPEQIILSVAINKMKIGDKFLIDDPVWHEIEMFKGENGLRSFRTTGGKITINLSVEIMNKKGQIIPEEPKVLSAIEAWRKSDTVEDNGDGNEWRDQYMLGFSDGDKNGQLKQWLNHKELREAVESYFIDGKYDSYKPGLEMHKHIMGLIKNLKPLKTE